MLNTCQQNLPKHCSRLIRRTKGEQKGTRTPCTGVVRYMVDGDHLCKVHYEREQKKAVIKTSNRKSKQPEQRNDSPGDPSLRHPSLAQHALTLGAQALLLAHKKQKE